MTASGDGDREGPGTAAALQRRAEHLFRLGHADEAQAVLIRALAVAGDGADHSKAELLERLGRYLDASSCSWTHDYFEQALAELRPDEPFHSKVKVLCSVGFAYVQRGRTEEGMGLLREAFDLARDVVDTQLEMTVHTVAAEALLALGTPEESIERTRRARRLGMESAQHHIVVRSYLNEARAAYLRTGSVGDALRIKRVGLRYARDFGELATKEGDTLRLSLVKDLIEAGHWSEADSLLGPAVADGRHGSINAVEETLVRCWLTSRQGPRPRTVPPFVELVESSSPTRHAYLLNIALAAAVRLEDYASVEELIGRALTLAEGILTPSGCGLHVVDALASAIESQCEGRHTLMHPDSSPSRLLDVIERTYPKVRGHVAATYELTDGVVAQARARCAPGPDAAARHWDEAIVVFRRTHARARLVTALLGRAALYGPVARARLLLDEAEQIARDMRAAPQLERIAALRGAGAATAVHTAPTAALTGRQQQVVSLLARGCTDREIAGDLGLSVRTVNAHVVQILGRLGVRNRAEVAAWYHRSGPVREV